MSREFYKPKNDGVYLHIYNQTVAMEFGQLPLGEIEKENFTRIIERHLLKYNIDLISLVLMGNHFHMLVYSHAERLSPQQGVKRYAKFHNSPNELEENDWRIVELLKHSNNVSEFMREVQGEFSKWFNKSRPYKRRGALWQDRFHCQLIQSDVYLWSCLTYIEQNPVRAGICEDPADYKFSSFGRWQKDKKHPYRSCFLKHVLSLVGNHTKLNEFRDYMHAKMKVDNLQRALEKVKDEDSKLKLSATLDKELEVLYQFDFQVVTFRKKDWKSQKVIGSEDFIQEKYREWECFRHSG